MIMAAVLMPSITHAMKAKKIFTAMGCICEIKRASNISKNGCTHYIAVNVDAKTVITILNNNNIKHGEIIQDVVG